MPRFATSTTSRLALAFTLLVSTDLTSAGAVSLAFSARLDRNEVAVGRARAIADRIVASLTRIDGRDWCASDVDFTVSGLLLERDGRLELRVRWLDGLKPKHHLRLGQHMPIVFRAVQMAAQDLARAREKKDFDIVAVRVVNARLAAFLIDHLGFRTDPSGTLRLRVRVLDAGEIAKPLSASDCSIGLGN